MWLEMKTEEVVAATRAASEAEEANNVAKAELQRLKQAAASETASLDQALKAEVAGAYARSHFSPI